MANKTIQMKHSNNGEWDKLFPITLNKNVYDEEGRNIDQNIEHNINTLKNDLNNKFSHDLGTLKNHFKDTFSNIVNLNRLHEGVEITTDDIQNAFNIARDKGNVTIFFENGIYEIDKMIRIYQNTTVIMSDRTVLKRKGTRKNGMEMMFINGEFGNLNYSSGYEGDGNIHFYGGVIDGGYKEFGKVDNTYSTGGFALIHGYNITFNNVTFENFVDNHVFELNACKRVRFNNCNFKDIIKNYDFLVEVIQIDFADISSIPYIGSHDNTVCDDIIIDGCSFINTPCGVGTHASKYVNDQLIFHKNIKVVNSTFVNNSEQAIRMESWNGFVVIGNTITECNKDSIYLLNSINGNISSNTVNKSNGHGIVAVNKSISGISETAKNVNISDNSIYDCVLNGIRLNTSGYMNISNNNIQKVGASGISIASSPMVNIIGNIIYNVNISNGYNYGIYIDKSIKCFVISNNIMVGSEVNIYRWGIGVSNENTDVIVANNNVEKGTLGSLRKQNNVMSLSPIDKEVFLTEIEYGETGDFINLLDDITEFKELRVVCGTVSQNNITSHVVNAWYRLNFVIGDIINCDFLNGNLSFEIVENKKIKILNADKNFRYIVGVK